MSHRRQGISAPSYLLFISLLAASATVISLGRAETPATKTNLPALEYVIHGSSLAAVRADVTTIGGTVVSSIPGVNDAVVRLTATAAAELRKHSGVLVVRDAPVYVTDAPPSTPSPADSVFPTVTGASSLVTAGDDGGHVTVAVLDTGIDASLPDFGGRVIDGVDLTGDNAPFNDQYGHGTFVAGLIGSSGSSSRGDYVGEAPGVNLVSIKVAGANGVTSVGTIVEGIAWAISHRVTDNIRVLNLSLGEVPEAPSALDPLDQAVEGAWDAGIVVVTTAGNAGPHMGTITSPGNDPLVITVGALDDDDTTNPADYSVPSFSGVGPTRYDGWLKPDVVAPGSSVVSLAAPGSTVDEEYPSARIGNDNFEGSGTSFSAAIVSGEVALILSKDPTLTPDEVKSRLLLTTSPGPVGNPFVDGHGITNVFAATTAQNVSTLDQTTVPLEELLSPAVSLLSLIPIVGLVVKLLGPWSDSTWNPSNWSGTPSSGEGWNIGTLPTVSPAVTGAAWNGAAWNGAAWNGAAWNEASWTGAAWNGAAWNGAAWNGAAWNGFFGNPPGNTSSKL